ncbi:MAG: hypothetical protein V2J51_12610 [Erythrobacter sp.]|nr:hypothetical protein [Erythrobacter sp.]
MNLTDAYLKGILSVFSRREFPPEHLASLVGGEKQREAYNLCDGTLGQAEIVKKLGLDKSNFRKTLNRWVDAGIAFRVEHDNEIRPLHLYSLPPELLK